jgi:hypothetical protein
MSTRCQILWKFEDGQVLTYRHSDGYPTGVLPDLVEFLKWNIGRNNQPDYLIANYFYWSKKHFERYVDYDYKTGKQKRKSTPLHKRKLDGNEMILLGYGLDYQGTLHGDIEFFYTVEIFSLNNDDFHPQLKYRIRAYTNNLDYEYPEQLIKNEIPFIEINIDDLEKYEIISDQEIETLQKKNEEEFQAKCKHESTDHYTNAVDDNNHVKIIYCKNCWKELEQTPLK